MRLEKTISSVLEIAKRETERPEWIEASVWSERMLAALDNGVKGGKYGGKIPTLQRLGFSLCTKPD